MENAIQTARLDRYFKDYASYHRTGGNKICHYVGIPMIVVTLLGLLSNLVIVGDVSDTFRMDAGVILWAIATFWYLTLDWKLGVPFSLVAAGCYFIGKSLPVPTLWAVFILGWVAQFIGHYLYEKKSPAFFKNLEHVLIGPLWIFAKLLHYRKPS